ncbi:MAG: FAD-binding oxidoreductase, partial [Propionibacterium sp.]
MTALGDLADRIDDTALTRGIYSTDASLYRVAPVAVAIPKNTAELVTIVRTALAAELPITSRGAGTSCAGNAVGPGLVIDCAKHLTKIIDIDPQRKTATIEPGVVQADLQTALTKFGLRFGPDPSTSSRCTIGGMIGNNACGPRALGYGRSADNVVELKIITGTGEELVLNADTKLPELQRLVASNLGTIRTEFGTFSRQVSGYSLEHLLPENNFQVAKFFAGSEGTLGVITQATVNLVADAPHKLTLALGYPTMADAGDDIANLLQFSPTACEGLDARIVAVVRRSGKPVHKLTEGSGWMFLEIVGTDTAELISRGEAILTQANAIESWIVTDQDQADALWKIRADGAGLAGVSLPNPAYGGWEDAAVPPAKLGAYLRAFDELLNRYELHGLPYGHFGEGCIHCRIDFPLDSA